MTGQVAGPDEDYLFALHQQGAYHPPSIERTRAARLTPAAQSGFISGWITLAPALHVK
jgi:hypothetical protein